MPVRRARGRPGDSHLYVPALRLVWRRAADVGEVLAEQPEPPILGYGDYLPEPCVLHPEEVTEHEYADLLPDDLRHRIRQWEEATGHSYQSLSIADGWKVGGYASWHLTDPHPMVCECGRDMRLLLTIASGEWDGNRVWRPVEDADEDSEFHSYLSPNTPTHVTIGRGYSLWVFRCPDSFEHRHRMTMQ